MRRQSYELLRIFRVTFLNPEVALKRLKSESAVSGAASLLRVSVRGE